jgi:hypothetical protein
VSGLAIIGSAAATPLASFSDGLDFCAGHEEYSPVGIDDSDRGRSRRHLAAAGEIAALNLVRQGERLSVPLHGDLDVLHGTKTDLDPTTVRKGVVIALDKQIAINTRDAKVESSRYSRKGGSDSRCERRIEGGRSRRKVAGRRKPWIVRPDAFDVDAFSTLFELDFDGFAEAEVVDQRGRTVEDKLAKLAGRDHSAGARAIP